MTKLESSPIEDGGYNTLVLTLFALNVYDVYIVMDHGVGYRKMPHHWLLYYVDGILC